MTIKIRKGGVLQDLALRPMRRAGNAWVPIQTIYRRTGGAWVPLWTAYTPVAFVGTPTALGTYGCRGDKCPLTVSITASLQGALATTGGNAAIRVAWTLLSGTAFAVANGNTLSPTFTANVNRQDGGLMAVYRCTATDGTSTATYDMTVRANYNWVETT